MKKQFNIIVVIIALISILSFAIISNYDYDGMILINAQTIDLDDNTSNTNIIKLENIPTKQVKVGDIDISYKIFGKGDPILLIMGYPGPMYGWDPIF